MLLRFSSFKFYSFKILFMLFLKDGILQTQVALPSFPPNLDSLHQDACDEVPTAPSRKHK